MRQVRGMREYTLGLHLTVCCYTPPEPLKRTTRNKKVCRVDFYLQTSGGKGTRNAVIDCETEAAAGRT